MAFVPVALEQWGNRSLALSGLTATKNNNNTLYYGCRATVSRRSGKYMFEYVINVIGNSSMHPAGFTDTTNIYSDSSNQMGWVNGEYLYLRDGRKMSGGTVQAYGVSYAVGDVIGVLLDLDAKSISFAKNGVNQGVAWSSVSNITNVVPAWRSRYLNDRITFNFGATALAYPMEGYNPWNYVVPQSLTGIFPVEIQLSTSFHRAPLEGIVPVTIPRLGDKQTADLPGLTIPVSMPGERYKIIAGRPMGEIVDAARTSGNTAGYKVSELLPSPRISVMWDGIKITPVIPSSNAQARFNLVITPTHQYRNQTVNISASNPQGFPLLGKYQLAVGASINIPFGEVFADIRNISIDLMPGQLTTGNNLCRLTYLYLDGSQEYLDFEIFKEEPKRTQVERLFRYYEGGYEGERLSPAYAAAPSIYPCFLVPDGQPSTLVKTTDYTSIPLVKYTDIQGVYIDGSGLRILVSFDKGVTWKAFNGIVWQTVALANIVEQGMSERSINAITLAQWAGVFKPTSIDFAISLNNSLSNYANPASTISTTYTLSGANQYQVIPVPANMLAVKIEYYLKGGPFYGNSSYSYAALLDEYVDSWTRIAYSGDNYQVKSGIREYSPNNKRPSQFRIGTDIANASLTIFTAPRLAYLKSINVQITPRLRTGYAFIM